MAWSAFPLVYENPSPFFQTCVPHPPCPETDLWVKISIKGEEALNLTTSENCGCACGQATTDVALSETIPEVKNNVGLGLIAVSSQRPA